jgi:thiol-disulfide isomerase/thioredoxin
MTRLSSVSRIGLCAAILALAGLAFAGDDKQKGSGGGDTMALEGKPAPDVSLKTLDGQDFKLSELKGSVVMMDYWATWCGPCRESLPHVNAISQDKDLAAKGLKVFAVNAHEEKGKVEDFVKKNNFSFSVPLDPTGDFGKSYKVRGIPTTVIVGRDGVIKKVFIGFGPNSEEQIKDALKDALKETV